MRELASPFFHDLRLESTRKSQVNEEVCVQFLGCRASGTSTSLSWKEIGAAVPMSHDPVIAPSTLTILPTYKCTAQCKECCFECSPDLRGRLSLEQILRRIDKAHAAFPFLKLVCFSGGECFTIGKDLDTAIAYAHGLALFTRCVSNGYWGSSLQAARKRVNPLAEAGLTELNLSTGDEHQGNL